MQVLIVIEKSGLQGCVGELHYFTLILGSVIVNFCKCHDFTHFKMYLHMIAPAEQNVTMVSFFAIYYFLFVCLQCYIFIYFCRAFLNKH